MNYEVEIIGVATDAIYGNLREETSSLIYLPGSRGQLLVVRAAGTPESVAASILNQIKAVDKNLLISGIKTVPQLVDQSLTLERLLAKALQLFRIACAGAGGYWPLWRHGLLSGPAYKGDRHSHGRWRPTE